MALIVTLLLGFGAILRLSPVKGGIGLIGGLILLWMAWGMISEARKRNALDNLGQEKGRGLPLPVAGAVISLSNPYWILWWATVGANYVLLGMKQGPLGLGLVYTGHTLADNIWLVFVSFVVSSGRALMNDAVYRGILLVCSLFLIVLGLYFARSGLRFMRSRGAVAPV
jgi:threonine/homoserine/homoserine lactone efflux protein